ncbi:MAG: class I adenylate-forming enzyme family protein [Pseudomonadota bacterium]
MEPCPAPFNLAAYVLAHAERTPDKIALSILSNGRSERWSYGRLAASVRAVGHGLLAADLAPGDHILLRLGNGVTFPLAFLGAIHVGLVPIPTSAQLTRPELDGMLGTVTPVAQIVGPDLATPSQPRRTLNQADLLSFVDGPEAAPVLGSPERLAYLIFTSGTSGTPRAVAHAHRAVWARRMMFDGWYGLRPDDRLLHAGALNWTFTLGTGLLDPWAMGATALIPKHGTDLAALPLLIQRHDATLFACAPGILRKLLKAPQQLSFPKLRHTLTAGEHLQPALREAWEAATGRGLYDAYGMTECSTFLSASPGGAPSLTPQPGRRVTLLKDGTIAIHRDEQGLMLGYWQDGAPSLPLTDDWFHTADFADWAEDGRIAYRGRRSDILNAGGYRISPQEVEEVLVEHPAIEEAALCELPTDGSSYLAACYVGEEVSEALLSAHLSERLARYKHPRAYLRLSALPRGPNGKLSRRALPAYFEV